MPTAPSPKSAATARAAWPPGWPIARLPTRRQLHLETDAGPRVCHVNAIHTAGEFTVEVTAGMGVPEFAPRTVTMLAGVQVTGVEVSTGNPHFVIVVDNPDFKSMVKPGKASDSKSACTPIFPTRPTSSLYASSARTNRDSHLRTRRRPHNLFRHRHPAPQPQRRSRCMAAVRRSPSLRPAARRPSPGTAPAQNCASPARPPLSRAARPGSMTSLRKPPAVPADAAVSVVSPASTPQTGARRTRPRRLCAHWATSPQPAEHLFTRGPLYFAGTPEQRLADLHHAFADDQIRAIFVDARRLRLQLPARRPRPRSHRRTSQAASSATATSPAAALAARSDPACPPFTAPCSPPISLSTTACISPAFTPRSPASPTSSAPPKAFAPSNSGRAQRHALRRLPQHPRRSARHALGAADRRQAALP